MWGNLKQLFSPSQYVPHGHCYLWQFQLVWLHIISDLLIALAYFSIPAMLIYFIYKRNDVPFLGIFGLFGAFIVLCGTGHLLEIWTLWHPAYWLTGIEKAMTALVSCYTALEMVTLLPKFLALQTPERLAAINQELQNQIIERQQAEQALQSIVSGTSSVTGEEFFPALVQNLAMALDVSHTFVAEMVSNHPPKLRTLAFWAGDKVADNFEYDLVDTPDQSVVTQVQLYYYPDKVPENFPKLIGLKAMGAVCYLGAPLLDGNQVIGVLCINSNRRLANEENAKVIIKVFAARAAAELQRQRAKSALSCAYEELEVRVNEATEGLRQGTAELVKANAALETEIQERIVAEAALKASQDFLARVLNTVTDPIFVKDRQYRWTMINDAFCQMMGYSREELIGKSDYDFLSQAEADVLREYDNQVFTTGIEYESEETLTDASGTLRILSTKKIAFADAAGNQALVGINRDITERKRKEAADAANRAKSEFLANMSHELRTPLNAILGFTQVMRRDSSLSTEQQQHLKIISRSGEHLLRLINDVLQMSKIEAGRVTLQEQSFNLYRLLDSLEELLHLGAASKGLRLTFERTDEVPQYVKTDESKLRQVLINLLGNAIKFTTIGSVTLRVSVPELASIHFEVEDTGQGIAASELDDLFEPFTQTETGLEYGEGTGLGLPISQKFVQLMGGEITASTILGQGAKFAFDIQVSSVEETLIETTQPISKKVTGLAPDQPVYRILIVEDKQTNRLLLVKLLSSLGFEVREAENGQEAVAIWENWEPHLIWMDMRMPVMNGYEATKQIKASAKAQATVIIALTASAFEEQRQAILSAGCDDFVRKPFREENLLAKISEYLGVRYIYEEKDEVVRDKSQQHHTPQEGQIHTSLQVMPTEWVKQLHYAAAQGSDLLIYQLIEQIPKQNFNLAVKLTNLVENFKFDQVMELAHLVKG